ncbi:hypothetical protein NL53_04310 [Vibrio variabilis]|uniref:Uncharacterized protein n=1 Tax=Vibrio variabilis TaxID=990271 RepID=A0ABR4YEF8_9VIBR|nr:hypothetical protein NL53_04310 [Vibrio variabilis]
MDIFIVYLIKNTKPYKLHIFPFYCDQREVTGNRGTDRSAMYLSKTEKALQLRRAKKAVDYCAKSFLL